MPVILKDIIKIIEKRAPLYLAADFDNPGLLIGDESSLIDCALIALDIDDNVIDEAAENNCNLIITHHPLIFSPIKKLNAENYKQRMILKLASMNINVYAAHTNLDACKDGINDYLALSLGLEDVSVLGKCYEDKLYKIAVYVPEGYENGVIDALTSAGAGYIGNYSCCTYSVKGEGTFKPLEGTRPFIGEHGRVEHVREVRIETIAKSTMVKDIIDAMLKSHPYEEPAYDIYPLKNRGHEYGFVRTGYLGKPITLSELCMKVKKMLNIDSVNVVGSPDRVINKVGLCSGNGSDFIAEAYEDGCDVFITGDIRYHNACDARDMGICLIDAGHFATESIYMAKLADYLKSALSSCNGKINIVMSQKNRNPVYKV